MIGDIIIKYHGSDRDQLLKKKKKKGAQREKRISPGPSVLLKFHFKTFRSHPDGIDP